MTTRVRGVGALLVFLVSAGNSLLWLYFAPTEQLTLDEMAAEAAADGVEFGTASTAVIGYDNFGVLIPAGPHWFPAVPVIVVASATVVVTALALVLRRSRRIGRQSPFVWWAPLVIALATAAGFWALSSVWMPRSFGFTFTAPDGLLTWMAANALFRQSMWIYLVECLAVAALAGGAVSAFATLGNRRTEQTSGPSH